jgi:hypothetical protein
MLFNSMMQRPSTRFLTRRASEICCKAAAGIAHAVSELRDASYEVRHNRKAVSEFVAPIVLTGGLTAWTVNGAIQSLIEPKTNTVIGTMVAGAITSVAMIWPFAVIPDLAKAGRERRASRRQGPNEPPSSPRGPSPLPLGGPPGRDEKEIYAELGVPPPQHRIRPKALAHD